MRIPVIYLAVLLVFSVLVSSERIPDQLHMNLLLLNASGEPDIGRFLYTFNISTDAACTDVVYTNVTDNETDSRGIFSHYLTNYSDTLTRGRYNCIYTNNTQRSNALIVPVPWAHRALAINASAIEETFGLNETHTHTEANITDLAHTAGGVNYTALSNFTNDANLTNSSEVNLLINSSLTDTFGVNATTIGTVTDPDGKYENSTNYTLKSLNNIYYIEPNNAGDLYNTVINCSGNCTIMVPPGVYALGTNILEINHTGTSIIGSGPDNTLITYSGGGPAIKTSVPVLRMNLEGFRLVYPFASAAIGLDMSNMSQSIARNLYIQDFNVGIKIGSGTSYYNLIESVTIQTSTSNATAIYLTGNENTVLRSRLLPVNAVGIAVIGHNNELISVDVETTSTPLLGFNISGHDTFLISPYVESAATGIRIAPGTESTIIIGGYLASNTYNLNDSGKGSIVMARINNDPFTQFNTSIIFSDIFVSKINTTNLTATALAGNLSCSNITGAASNLCTIVAAAGGTVTDPEGIYENTTVINTTQVNASLGNISAGMYLAGTLGFNLTQSADDLYFNTNVAGSNFLQIGNIGAFIQLFANPGPANDDILFTITETQGSTTELNFYEGGTGNNRFWDSGSMRVGGDASSLCNALSDKVDCNTPLTGADLLVEDDFWFGGDILNNGTINISKSNEFIGTSINVTDASNIQTELQTFNFSNSMVRNVTVDNQTPITDPQGLFTNTTLINLSNGTLNAVENISIDQGDYAQYISGNATCLILAAGNTTFNICY